MEWLKDYQLFLFDLDGLLVNTEEMHYRSYKEACGERGLHLPWDFPEYCRHAHYRAQGLKEEIFALFPQLEAEGWESFYQRKCELITEMVTGGDIELMAGAQELLQQLEKLDKPRCVVTHSKDQLVNPIREKHPVLNTIPFWFTRGHYSNPKPHPECYQQAIEKLSKPGDSVIGFEDTPRGLQALMGTTAQSVLICCSVYPEIEEYVEQGVLHYPSLDGIKDLHQK